MSYKLNNCNRLLEIVNLGHFDKVVSSSYFKDDRDLKQKINALKQTKGLICLDIDCTKKIFGINPHLPIYSLCNMYEKNPQEATKITEENAAKIASKLLQNGIDIYFSPIMSFSSNIFNSLNANENFLNYHIAIFSAWIQGLNLGGMSCCVKLAPDFSSSKLALSAFKRLRLQVTAVVLNHNELDLLSKTLCYNGAIVEIVDSKSISNALSLQSVLQQKHVQSLQHSIEI